MDEVGCLVGQAEILVAQLEVSVLLVDIYGMAKKYGRLKVFLLEVVLEGYLGVSGTFILQISCGT